MIRYLKHRAEHYISVSSFIVNLVGNVTELSKYGLFHGIYR